MKENKNTRKFIQEAETLNEITLQQLSDMCAKIEVAIIPFTNSCLAFNNQNLKHLSSQLKLKVDELGNMIRTLVLNNGQDVAVEKTQIERPQPAPEDKVIESKVMKESFVKKMKKLLEAMESMEEEEEAPFSGPDAERSEDKEDKPTEETKKEINLSDAFMLAIEELDEEGFNSFKSAIVEKLKGSGITEPSFQDVVKQFEESAGSDEINDALTSLYDYADSNNITVFSE